MEDGLNCWIEIELPFAINIRTDGSHLREKNQESYLKNLQAKFLGAACLYKYRKSNPQS
jgi:hypothetical protein